MLNKGHLMLNVVNLQRRYKKRYLAPMNDQNNWTFRWYERESCEIEDILSIEDQKGLDVYLIQSTLKSGHPLFMLVWCKVCSRHIHPQDECVSLRNKDSQLLQYCANL